MSKKKKIIIISLIVAIISVVVAIISSLSFQNKSEEAVLPEYPGFAKIYENADSYDEAIETSQEYIDNEKDIKEKAVMLNDRCDFLLFKYASLGQHQDQIINDAKEIDSLIQSESTAFKLFQIYVEYEMKEEALEYEKIIVERGKTHDEK